MQRKYLENLNFAALEVACLSALDRPLRSEDQWSKDLRTAAEDYATAVKATNPLKDLKAPAEALATQAMKSKLTAFGAYCLTDILPTTQQTKGQILKWVLDRAQHERDLAAERRTANQTLEETRKYSQRVKELLEVLDKLPRQ
jgi:hypothetical protein